MTAVAVERAEFHTPTWTIIRLPVVTGADMVAAKVVPEPVTAVLDWTKATGGEVAGVTALDAADSGPGPTAFVARTRNV